MSICNLGSNISAIRDIVVNSGSWVTPTSPANTAWYSSAWSPELGILALGSGPTGSSFITSSNGTTWTTHTSPAANRWRGMTWSSELGIFCAVSETGSGNRVATSSDGTTWTSQSATDNTWRSVEWSPELGLFCAVGYSDMVMTSPDGVTWTSQFSGAGAGSNWSGITWSPELGIFCSVGAFVANVMTSPDGVNWTSQTVPTNDGAPQNMGIAWSPELNLFAITGDAILTSPDGTNWTTQTNPSDDLVSVTWSPQLGLFAAVRNNVAGTLAYSTDGITWASESIGGVNPNTIVWSPGLNLFVTGNDGGNTGERLRVSDNDFSAYNQTTILGNRAVTDVSIFGKDIAIGQSANNVTIGQYATGVTIGGPGVPVSIGGSFMGVSQIWDQKTSGSNAGNGTASTFNTRTLNNIENYGNINCTLDSNQFTLGPGSYFITASAPGFRCSFSKLRLRDCGNTQTVLVGSSEYNDSGAIDAQTRSFIFGNFSINVSTCFEIQQYISSASGGSQTFGAASSSGEPEIYTQVMIYRLF